MFSYLLFFSLGGGEIIFILFIALILFGAKNLTSIARQVGKGVKEIKNLTNDVKNEINDVNNDDKDKLIK